MPKPRIRTYVVTFPRYMVEALGYPPFLYVRARSQAEAEEIADRTALADAIAADRSA